MTLYLVQHPVQNIESDYCGVFQPYFYNHFLVKAMITRH